jgi:hypothetical protein
MAEGVKPAKQTGGLFIEKSETTLLTLTDEKIRFPRRRQVSEITRPIPLDSGCSPWSFRRLHRLHQPWPKT